MNSVLEKDLLNIINSEQVEWKKIENSVFLITGSTGLLGSIIVKALLLKDDSIKLVLPVRDMFKAKKMFDERENITYIETDVENFGYDGNVDYVIHAASPTKSKYFVTYPIETLDTAILGTKRILNYCSRKKVKSVVYLSSMEMYGVTESDSVNESDLGFINNLDIRSSYSEGKRVCELYCKSYYEEKGVPVKIARLAMTFGPGVSQNENRVYKYLCDSVLNKENIVLKSLGNTVINYCYTVDAVIGILRIMLNGVDGEAYNVVGDFSGLTIKKSAEWLNETYGQEDSKVICEIPIENTGFAPENTMVLNNEKLRNLGWNPSVDIKEAFYNLLLYLKEEYYGK